MTHVDDLYEVNDREPGEPDPEPTYTLDQIQGALTVYLRGQDPRQSLHDFERSEAGQAASFLLDTAAPLMLAELRAARERLARYEEATKEEWAVTDDASSQPIFATQLLHTGSGALKIAARDGKQAWRRVVTRGPVVVHPWEPISPKAPF